MNAEETGKILGQIAVYDNRKVDALVVVAWHRVIGDLPYDDAMAAVIAFFAESTERIMPAEIRRRVKATREQRFNAASIEAPADPDDEESYRRQLANIRRRIGDGRMPFKAIPSGGGAEPSEIKAVAEVRDELAERRLREIRDRNPRPDPTGPTCECGAALDPDGFCFTCETRTGASS